MVGDFGKLQSHPFQNSLSSSVLYVTMVGDFGKLQSLIQGLCEYDKKDEDDNTTPRFLSIDGEILGQDKITVGREHIINESCGDDSSTNTTTSSSTKKNGNNNNDNILHNGSSDILFITTKIIDRFRGNIRELLTVLQEKGYKGIHLRIDDTFFFNTTSNKESSSSSSSNRARSANLPAGPLCDHGPSRTELSKSATFLSSFEFHRLLVEQLRLVLFTEIGKSTLLQALTIHYNRRNKHTLLSLRSIQVLMNGSKNHIKELNIRRCYIDIHNSSIHEFCTFLSNCASIQRVLLHSYLQLTISTTHYIQILSTLSTLPELEVWIYVTESLMSITKTTATKMMKKKVTMSVLSLQQS